MIVVLDVNETLSDLGPVDDLLGAEPRAAWFAGVLRDGFALTVHGAAPPFADVARAALLTAGHDEATADRAMTAFGSLGLHPDVAPGLRALTEAGHRVVTLTNGSTGYTRDLLERAGVLDLVERTLAVEDSGRWKPHPAAYALALDALGVPAADLTLVAAHPWDVDGARRAGLAGVFLDRSGSGAWPEPFGARPRTITALGDLVA